MYLKNTLSVVTEVRRLDEANDATVGTSIASRIVRDLVKLTLIEKEMGSKSTTPLKRLEYMEGILGDISAQRFDMGSSEQNGKFRNAFFSDYNQFMIEQLGGSTPEKTATAE